MIIERFKGKVMRGSKSLHKASPENQTEKSGMEATTGIVVNNSIARAVANIVTATKRSLWVRLDLITLGAYTSSAASSSKDLDLTGELK